MTKKKFFMILGCFAFFIGIIVTGIVIRKSNISRERETAYSYCIDNMDINIDKDSQYHDYITEVLAETIKDENGVKDCQINLDYSNSEIISANVSVAVEDDKINISETDILDYVSKSLDISTEDVIVSYD